MVKYRLKIIDIKDVAQGTKTYYLEKPSDFIWEEGAHTHIGLPGFDEGEFPNKNLVRHMSIMTLPDEGIIAFTTRVPGSSSEFKETLSRLHVGDEVTLFKIGSRMRLRREDKPVVLLSMGVGITTMRPLILAYSKDNSHIPLLVHMNVDSSGEFLFQKELDLLVKNNDKNDWLDSKDNFYKRMEELSERLKMEHAIYYIVGSDGFIKEVIQCLRSKNVKDSDIVLDKKEENLSLYFGA